MTAATDLFIETARSVPIQDAAAHLGLKFSGKRTEHAQACPACGGTDCFAFNTAKNKWNCRAGDVGGQDAIGMAAHILDLDLKKREHFLEACSAVSGEPVPDGAERISEAERQERQAAIDRRRRENAEAAAEREKNQNHFKELERGRALGIWEAAKPEFAGTDADSYLRERIATSAGFADRLHLRFSPQQTYWHGKDESGRPAGIHSGPASIGLFVDGDQTGIGCHITWIDLANPPKFRPGLGLDDKGKPIPTKKMRGSKKGGLIPVAGDWLARRWVVGEGIETVCAVAVAEGFRDDTFYCAAGDIGNLAGVATAKGRTRHPTLKKTDKNGRERPVMVPSPFPDPDRLAEGFPVLPHVTECVLLAENDSERVATAALMARACARVRLIAPASTVPVVWPPAGYGDFCDLMARRRMAA